MASLYLAQRILLESARSRRVFVLWLLFPLAMLLLFGWVRADGAGGFGPAFTQTAPGILIGAALFFSCLGGPVSVLAGERERGTLDRLLVSPLSGRGYVVGLALAHGAIALGQAAVVYGVTYAAGGRFAGSVLEGVALLLLCVAGYVGVGFVLGARLTSGAEEINGTVAGVGVPLLVLGGTFFPAEVMPPVLYGAAHLNPIFHMNQVFRAAAWGEAWESAGGSGAGRSLILLMLFTAVVVWWGGRAFDRMIRSPAGGRVARGVGGPRVARGRRAAT